MIREPILPLFVAIPLAGAFLTSLFGKRSKLFSDLLASASTMALFLFSIFSIWWVRQFGIAVYKIGGWIPPFGICMVLDGLTAFMLITLNLIAMLCAIYSIRYMEQYTAKWNFYTLFLLMVAGLNGVIVTGDLFNLFVFFEIASIASYALVAFGVEPDELEASFKYMVLSSMAAFLILLGIAILYSYTSTLNMADISLSLAKQGKGMLVGLVGAIFLMGFGLKSALVPFHAWLPDAHPSAPAPISAMLSGVFVKTLGVYALLRVFFNILGMTKAYSCVLIFLGAFSMAVGALLAMGQRDIKRLLAYSTISQIGYIVFAVGLWTPLGILAGLFHLFNHAMIKSLLFLNSGAIVYSAQTRDLQKMGGLAQRMPVTSNTSLVGSLSVAGIPPLGGFWSKLLIIAAAIQAGRYGYALLAIVISILTLGYFMRLQREAFFGELPEGLARVKEAPLFMSTVVVILAFLCILAGFVLLPAIRGGFLAPAVDALMNGTDYANSVFVSLR